MKNNKRQVIDALTAKLMEQARCKFECEGGHLCGLQQRKFDDGSQTTLKGVWRGPVFKGFVCDKHQPQIPQNRTFRTLRAIASLIAEHSLSLPGVVVDTLPESIHPPRNGDGGQGKRRRRRNRGHKHGRKSEAPHEERKAEPSATHSSATLGAGNASKPEPTPAAQKPVTAEATKTNSIKRHLPGERLRAKITDPRKLGWFNCGPARRAFNRHTRIIPQLCWTVRGRKLLRDIGLGSVIARVTDEQLASVSDADKKAKARSQARMLGCIRKCLAA